MRKLVIYAQLAVIVLLLILQFGPSVLLGGQQNGLDRMVSAVSACGADCVRDFEEYLRAYWAYIESELGWGNAFEAGACMVPECLHHGKRRVEASSRTNRELRPPGS
jgi:hypothetical protein